MALQVEERTPNEGMERPTPRRRRSRRTVVAIVLAAALVGVAAGIAAARIAADHRASARIASALPQSMPAQHTWRIAVTGTGPGLRFVADRQAAFVRRVITGTGPGLTAIAIMQAGGSQVPPPTGTLGAGNVPGALGPEVVMVDTP